MHVWTHYVFVCVHMRGRLTLNWPGNSCTSIRLRRVECEPPDNTVAMEAAMDGFSATINTTSLPPPAIATSTIYINAHTHTHTRVQTGFRARCAADGCAGASWCCTCAKLELCRITIQTS